MKDNNSILIIVVIAFLAFWLLKKSKVERYSNIAYTNDQQVPNHARYPNSIADAYILNYQYVYPGPVVGMRDVGKCNTY